MRISTTTFSTDAVNQIDALQVAINGTQENLSTGLAVRSAADNPTAMSQINTLNVEVSASTQYVTNSNAAQTNLQLEEQALSDASNLMQNVNELAVEANNSSLTASQRQNIATELQQNLQTLVAIGNRTDSNGNYLFSGIASGTTPFSLSGNTVTYNGATSVNQVQISQNQSVSTGDTGSTAFMNTMTGNGTFTVSASATNTGTASVGAGSIVNASQWVSGTYTLTFSDPSDYQITDSSGNVVSSGTYSDGNTISFNGAQITLSGTPAANDSFTIAPSTKTSAFATITNLIGTLNNTSLSSAQLATQIGESISEISGAITNFSNVSASAGARVNAITSSQTTATAVQTSLKTNISSLQDADYAAETTKLSTEELALQAAEESYASIGKMSLFQYLS